MDLVIEPYNDGFKKQILDIAKQTWGGMDHLLSHLERLSTEAASHPFVLTFEGKLVAFANLRVFENDVTGWMEYLRVHPDFRQQGLGKVMTDHLVSKARTLGLKRIRLTLATVNPAPAKLATSVGMHELFRLQVFWTSKSAISRWQHKTFEIESLNPSLLAEESVKELLPRGIISYHWYAVNADTDGLSQLTDDIEFFIGHRGNKAASISVGLQNTTRFGPEWCSTIYAQDKDAFLTTLSFHFNLARERGIQNSMVMHDLRFTSLFDSEDWMCERHHEIVLALYERKL